jgi:glycosyltransferase involved in cell wall biosynthesis
VRVGIITRVYGTPEAPRHQFLWEAFHSVLAQRHQDWHHVIVDDASRDGCAAQIAKYVDRQDMRGRATSVRLGENVGPAEGFNVAIRAMPADCDWVCCVDSDDKIDARYLSEAAEAVTADPRLNVVYAPCRHFGSVHSVYRFRPFNPRDMLSQCHIPGQAIYRRSLWDAVGGHDVTMRSGEDWDFFIRAQLAVGLRVRQLDAPRWYYRVHEGPRLSIYALSHGGADVLRQYWKGHTRQTVLARSRTFGAWCASRGIAA